jgi:hypothetical protein
MPLSRKRPAGAERVPTNIPIKNTNQTNQLKVVTETAEVDAKTKKKEWKAPVVTYLKPGESYDVWVGENRRFTVQELPT